MPRRLPIATLAAAALSLLVAGPAFAWSSRSVPGVPTLDQPTCLYATRLTSSSYSYTVRVHLATTGGKPVNVQARSTFPTATGTIDFAGSTVKLGKRDLTAGYVDVTVSTQSDVTGPANAVWAVVSNGVGSTSSPAVDASSTPSLPACS